MPLKRWMPMALALFLIGELWLVTPTRGRALAAGSRLARAVTYALPSSGTQEPVVARPSGGCPSSSRAKRDRSDRSSKPQVHIVYLVPRDSRDEHLDTNGTLACAVLAMNAWLKKEGSIEWRLDVTSGSGGKEVPDITFIRSKKAADDLAGVDDVGDELAKRGFLRENKRYLSYVASDAGGVCGDAWYPVDVSSDQVDGKYAAVYLDSSEGCGTRRFGVPGAAGPSEAVAMQELIHNDGLVPIGAPHNCSVYPGFPISHVCTGPLGIVTGAQIADLDPEAVDVMFPFVTGRSLEEMVLDRDHDDYFQHVLPLRDLERSAFVVAL
jgi:hypothetical protein